jgi:hypothetical protein
MANVGFKRGPQANLEALVTNSRVIDGVFYLTSDTNRLYIGKGTNELAPVNEGIITVANVSDLDNLDSTHKIAGAFCYVTGGNILCVYNGTKWIQINSIHIALVFINQRYTYHVINIPYTCCTIP